MPDTPETSNLDVADVLDEMGRAHTELAAHGSTPLVAELAQLRVLVRQQAKQNEALRGQIPGSATAKTEGAP